MLLTERSVSCSRYIILFEYQHRPIYRRLASELTLIKLDSILDSSCMIFRQSFSGIKYHVLQRLGGTYAVLYLRRINRLVINNALFVAVAYAGNVCRDEENVTDTSHCIADVIHAEVRQCRQPGCPCHSRTHHDSESGMSWIPGLRRAGTHRDHRIET